MWRRRRFSTGEGDSSCDAKIYLKNNIIFRQIKISTMMSGLPGGCNPADVLFKLAHARGISAPVFVQVSEQGPPHDKTFSWSCSFLQGQYNSQGQGRSKKEARNASAKSLITQLDLSTLPQVRE